MKLNGIYTDAEVFTSVIDEETKNQILTLINQESMKETKIAIMPDCHAGKGCVIGTTMSITNKVIPNLVGVDIGCGMLVVSLGKLYLELNDFDCLDTFIRKNIPCGFEVNKNIIKSAVDIANLRCFDHLKNTTYLKMSLGTLGGGNHFIEIDKSKDDNYYLIIHTGSRNLGKQVADYYQNLAITYHKNKLFNKRENIENVIKELKLNGKEKEIESMIKKIKDTEITLSIPEDLCYLENNDFDDYLFDMDICQKFASENRMVIANKIVNYLLNKNLKDLSFFETIHNYINMNDMILRKGAISSYKDELLLIPLNMRDGCILGKGKGNSSYNYSAPHGAGRIMSRKQAKDTVSLDDFEESMKGIYSTTINKNTLDESPFAYKQKEAILENILDTVEIIEIIKPIYNFKCDR